MKRISLTLIMAVFVIFSNAQVPSNGLVGWWPFNGNANDESLNGHNGTVTGATLTTDRFGNSNSAYSFNGISNYITVPDNPALKPSEVSISVWVKLNGFTCTQTGGNSDMSSVIFKKNSSSSYYEGYMIGYRTDLNKFHGLASHSGANATGFSNTVTLNEWKHIVLTVNSTQLKFYENGVLLNTIATGFTLDYDNVPLYFGSTQNSYNGYFNGDIDDIGIWNRILTQDEVTVLHEGCNSSTPITLATASNNGPICSGGTLNLTSGGGTGYSWSGPNGYTSIDQNPTISTVTVANAGIYQVTVTGAGGCTSTAQTTVVVNPLPTPSALNNGPLCEGSALNLTATGGLSYNWSGPNYNSNAQNPVISPVSTISAGTYTVTVTGTGGCTSTAQTTVAVNPTVTSITDIAICPSALPYIWNGLTFTTAGSQTATLTSVSGCDSLATLNLTINPTSVSNNPVSICMGESYVFNGHTYTTTGNYIDTLQTIHGCDSIVTTHLAVLDPASVHGTVVYSGGYIGSGDAMVILYQTGPSGHHQLVDSVMIGANGTFSLLNIPSGDYYLYVKLLNHSAYQHVHNSYFNSTYQWQEAAILNVDCATDTNITVHMVETGPANPGNGHITGTIQQYTNNKTIGDPLPGVEIYVKSESNNEPVANCASKSNGVYEFTEIPNGSYSIYVDIPGIPMIQTHTGISVTASDTLFGNLNFYVDTTTLTAGIYTNEILSVSKIETPELSVNIFPNPVKNELSIEVSNQTEELSIEVLDINGKSLYKSTTGNRAKIEMNAFATGVYLIKIQSKNTVIFKKIIKE